MTDAAIIKEGLEYETRIEEAASDAVWSYADWLLEKFGPAKPGRNGNSVSFSLPHPSGINRALNDPELRRATGAVLRDAAS